MRTVDVAVVGGGPAGAATAALLAGAGRAVLLLERQHDWHWRACGVFSSPATLAALRRVGLDDATLARVARPTPAMRVEPDGAPAFRLTYGGDGAVGFDRSALDPALVRLAASTGAEVARGTTVVAAQLGARRWTLRVRDHGREQTVGARLVVGADGIRSIVARAAGVARAARIGPRVGLTYHLPEDEPVMAREARMRVLRDGYVGIAPVPGGRLNIGIVLGRSWRDVLARDGAAAVAARIVAAVPPTHDDPAGWRLAPPCELPAGASPIGHRVTRRSGPGWLLVGDAAGFLDPFTGEGLHRAIVSAELAARAADASLAGRPDALEAYDRAMRRRFASKDLVSGVVQAFLARPRLFGYAASRLAARDRVRETMGLVMGDLVPASRALDPRFLAALLAP